MENSPSGLWRTLGKRVGVTASRVRISYSPPAGFSEQSENPFLILKNGSSNDSNRSRPCVALPSGAWSALRDADIGGVLGGVKSGCPIAYHPQLSRVSYNVDAPILSVGVREHPVPSTWKANLTATPSTAISKHHTTLSLLEHQ